MCDFPNRETAMTPLRWDDNGTPTVWCDPCLAELIHALNSGSITTTASCCGHNGTGSDGQQQNAPGWVMLRDGRVLLILADQDSAARITREVTS